MWKSHNEMDICIPQWYHCKQQQYEYCLSRFYSHRYSYRYVYLFQLFYFKTKYILLVLSCLITSWCSCFDKGKRREEDRSVVGEIIIIVLACLVVYKMIVENHVTACFVAISSRSLPPLKSPTSGRCTCRIPQLIAPITCKLNLLFSKIAIGYITHIERFNWYVTEYDSRWIGLSRHSQHFSLLAV